MFYLKHFFYNIKKQKVLGGFFLFSTIIYLFLTLSLDSFAINRIFLSQGKNLNPYFTIVLDKKYHESFIKLKDKDIPGIKEIAVNQKKSLNNYKSLQKQALLNLTIYKITLVKNIENETVFLIKNYIKKYLKLEFLSSSKVTWNREIKVKYMSEKIIFFKGVISFLWLLFFWVILTRSYSVFFILENFSRKKNALFKSFSFGLGVCFVLALGANIITVNNLSLLNAGFTFIIIAASLLLIRKYPELIK